MCRGKRVVNLGPEPMHQPVKSLWTVDNNPDYQRCEKDERGEHGTQQVNQVQVDHQRQIEIVVHQNSSVWQPARGALFEEEWDYQSGKTAFARSVELATPARR